LLTQLRTLDAAVIILTVVNFVSSLGIAIMLPLIPLYAISLGAAPVQLGLLTSAFALANAVAQLAAGLAVDRTGSRSLIQGGIATYAGANVLIATAATAPMLIAYRTLAGFGAGVNIISTRLYLAAVADPAHMAFVNGVISAAYSAGQVVGPAFGGIISALANLRLPFLIVGATSSLAFAGSLWLRRPAAREAQASQAAGTGPASGFNRAAVVLFLAQFFLLAGYGGFITTYAPLATQGLGWTTFEVGLAFSVFGLGSILLGPWLSHLADRTGRRLVAALSMLPVALFGAGMAAGLPRPVLYVIMFGAGAGITTFTAAWFALLREAAPAARRGRTFGVVSAGSNLGTVAGAMIASALWETASLRAAMLSSSVPVIIAGATLLMLPRERV
jgi:MFS family permease